LLAAAALACAAPGNSAEGRPFEWIQPSNYLWYYQSPLDDTLQPYHVYIPRDFDPQQAHPVVVFLHGFGGRTGTAAPDAWRQNWADGSGWILVSADGRGNQNWDFLGEDDLYLVLEDMRRTTPYHAALNVDTRRLYLEGGSMGGHGGYREAFRYPDRFAATAPAAGWTTYREFYEHFYDRTGSPRMPDYVDPARQPVLETASSLWQAGNARHMWTYLVYDTNDGVNPPVNQEEVLRKLRAIGSNRFATRVGEAGHVGSYSAAASYHFFSTKQSETHPPDVFYTTNDLRYNRSYWVTIDRLCLTRTWGFVDAAVVSGREIQRVKVKTDNVLAFTLDLSGAPVDLRRPVYIQVDNGGARPVTGNKHVSFRAWLDDNHELTNWSQTGSERKPAPTAPRKRMELGGPVAEAFRTPFAVIYGTRGGTLEATLDNGDWTAAEQFAAEWNAWMVLHWGGGDRPPADRRDDWWVPPYPFPNGPLVPASQPILRPLPDTAFAPDTLPVDKNLILFGDPATNWIVRQFAAELPLALSPPHLPPGIRVGSRLYTGDHVNYLFVAPNPRNPKRYVVIARGYLSSRVDPSQYGAGNVGKDLEALPFYWPDYVVWDGRRRPAEAKQKPFVYLPEAFLDAGYFADDWQLDATPPRTKIKIERLPAGGNEPEGAWKVSVSARDAPGGFGVAGIERRLDHGPWRPCGAELLVAGGQTRVLAIRATDKCGQFVYDHSVSPSVGRPAPGNVEAPQVFELSSTEGPAKPN
jgi:hypothetical protein